MPQLPGTISAGGPEADRYSLGAVYYPRPHVCNSSNHNRQTVPTWRKTRSEFYLNGVERTAFTYGPAGDRLVYLSGRHSFRGHTR